MSFVILVLVFVSQRRLDLPVSRVFDNGLKSIFQRGLFARFSSPMETGIWLFLLLVFSLILFSLQAFLYQIWMGVGFYLLELILLFCLVGDSGYKTQRQHFLQSCSRKDYTAAHHILSACYPTENVYRISSPQELLASASHWQLNESFRRYFIIIFWFTLLGAPAALIVRLIEQLALAKTGQRGGKIIGSLYELLAFLPSRALAISFFLSGQLTSGGRDLIEGLLRPDISSVMYLYRVARHVATPLSLGSSMSANQSFESILDRLRTLLSRSLALWFAFIALMTLLPVKA